MLIALLSFGKYANPIPFSSLDIDWEMHYGFGGCKVAFASTALGG